MYFPKLEYHKKNIRNICFVVVVVVFFLFLFCFVLFFKQEKLKQNVQNEQSEKNRWRSNAVMRNQMQSLSDTQNNKTFNVATLANTFCRMSLVNTDFDTWIAGSYINASVKRKPWTPPPQGSTQIRRRDDVESWGVYFQGLVNLDLINFLTMWIFTLCEFRPGESWTNAVYISSENVLNTKN